MSDEDGGPVVWPKEKNQRTLFSLAKVVRLDSTSMCFTLEEIRAMRENLMVPSHTKHELLTILRKLDCYKLQVDDLKTTDIGAAVATLASRHPKPDVQRLASSLLQKWRDMVEISLFQPQIYDVEAAAAAEDGEAAAPEDLIAAEREQQRLEKLERRRQRIEDDFMAVSSSEEEKSEDEDEDWAPGLINTRSKQKSCSANPATNQRRSRSGRLAAAAKAAGEKASAEVAAGSGNDAENEGIGITSDGEKSPPEEPLVNETSRLGEVLAAAPMEGGTGDVKMVDVEPGVVDVTAEDKEPFPPVAEEAPGDVAAPAQEKKVPKARPTIFELLQRQAKMHSQASQPPVEAA